MKNINSLIVLFLLLFLLNGCKKEDDYVYPPVITEILCAQTDASGTVAYLNTDQGKSYKALNGSAVKGLSADSVYRVYCVYELSSETDGGVLLYAFSPLLSVNPVKAERFPGGVKTDPVNPVSVWRSGDYINLSVEVMAMDLKKHRFHFVENGIVNSFGSKILQLTLYHDQDHDVEAYYQQIYMSVPLRNFTNILSPGDQILFKINTFDGMKVFDLKY